MLFIVIHRKTIKNATLVLLLFIMAYMVFNMFLVTHALNLEEAAFVHSKYIILINIDEKTLFLFNDNKCVKEYPIATGTSEWPSPIGQWRIVEKSDWGEGFGGHWMGLNVIWGTYGIHGTSQENTIGHSASHGCIRMFNNEAKDLYEIVPIGTPVLIKNGDYGPFGTGFRKLGPGDRGADVLAIQQKLKELGYFSGDISGIYEDDLKIALYSFQKNRQLRIKYTLTYEDYLAMGFSEIE